MKIEHANLADPDVQDLLDFHVRAARTQCASHVFDAARLEASGTTMFAARNDAGALLGLAGLKRLTATQGEVKSVRTHPDHLRKGVSRALMEHLMRYAQSRGISELFLETHPTDAYAPARALYERLGYRYCPPFGDYEDTGESVFMVCSVAPTTGPLP